MEKATSFQEAIEEVKKFFPRIPDDVNVKDLNEFGKWVHSEYGLAHPLRIRYDDFIKKLKKKGLIS